VAPQTSRVVAVAREVKAEILRRDRQVVDELADRYVRAARQLEPRIEALAERLAREAAQGIEHTKGSLYQMDRWADMQAQLKKVLTEYHRWYMPWVEAKRQSMGELGLVDADKVAQASGVAVQFSRLSRGAVEDMIARTSRGPLAELLVKAYGDTAQAIGDRLVAGTAFGWNPRKVAREASAALGIDLDRTTTIARTEQLRSYRMPKLERWRGMGIEQYRRVATHDDRVCIGCLVEDGRIYPTADFDAHPNCRCDMVPFIPKVSEPSWQSSEEWFKGRSAEQQLKMMGPSRREMWAKGEVRWDDLSRRTWSDEWGGAIGPRPVHELHDIAAGTLQPVAPSVAATASTAA